MILFAASLLFVMASLLFGCLMLVRYLTPPPRPKYSRRPKVMKPATNQGLDRDNEKVREEIVGLWAKLKNPTSKYVAYLFNRRHAWERASIADNTVLRIVKLNQSRLTEMRKAMGKRPPAHVPWQLIWSADLTFRRDGDGKSHRIFGLVEHYSRICLQLRVVPEKSATVLLRCLCDAIDQFGRPRMLRTDNEAPFRSKLFRGFYPVSTDTFK